jgi:hypothetical protein
MFILAWDPVEGDLARAFSTLVESVGGSLIELMNVDRGFINRLCVCPLAILHRWVA